MPKYNSYIELSPNYESVVDIDSDNRNPNLWREYIVHEDMRKAIEKICDSLRNEYKDARRSFWIHGAYGTGKSYSAIVLKHLFEDSVNNINEFMSGQYGQSALTLLKYRDKFVGIREKGDFLVVWRSGCTGIRTGTELMMEMEVSIRDRLAEKYGGKAYYGRNSIVSSVQEKLSDPFYNWDAVFNDPLFALYEDYLDLDNFRAKIENGEKEACTRAAEICRQKGWGMFNSVEQFEDWLADIVEGNHLKDTGIVFIWDEFTDFVRESGDDNVLQRLSEFCKQQPFFLFLIVHVDMSWVSKLGEDTYTRILHRYHELEFHITESAAYDLIGNSIIVRTGMLDTWKDVKNRLMQTIETNLADFDNLEPGFSRERLKNLCPIHPITLSLLASVAQNFGASQRTLFRFMKDMNEADQNVGFNYYISSNGPDDWKWLTADYLWDYFFTRQSDIKESFSKEAYRTYQHYTTYKDAVGADAIASHVFKSIMLLIAVMSTDKIGMVRGANRKLAATKRSLYKCLAGVLGERDIDNWLDVFEENNWVRLDKQSNGDARLELPYSGNVEKFDVRLEQTKRKYTRYTLFLKKGQLSSSVEKKMWDANRNTFGRIEVIACSHETSSFSLRLNELKTLLVKNPYKIGLFVVTISDEGQYAGLQTKLKATAEAEHNSRLVLCALKEPFNEDQLEQWHSAITHKELANEEGKRGSSTNYETEAELVTEKWASSATDNQLTAFYLDNHYPVVYGKDDLRKRIESDVFYSVFPYAPERIVTQNTAFKSAQLSAAEFAVTRQTANTQIKNIATALDALGVWDAKGIREIIAKNDTPGAKAVSELAQYLSNELSIGAKVKLDSLWDVLGKEPFGYYNTIASAFLLGFVLRFYKEGQSSFNWIDAVDNTHLLTDQNLAKLILNMCKGDVTNNILSSGSETWNKFKDYPKSIFGLSDAEVASEEKTAISLKARIDKVGAPLWVLKYIDDAKVGGTDTNAVINKATDAFSAFISDGADREDAMSDIIETFKGNGVARKAMIAAFADTSMLNDAFKSFIYSNEPDLMAITNEIGLTATNLHDDLVKFMQAAIYTWTEDQVKEKLAELLAEYRIVGLLNKALGVRKKNLSELRGDLANAFENMRVPGSVVEALGFDWIPALKIMKRIMDNGDADLTAKNEFINVLSPYAAPAWEYVGNSKLLLEEYFKKQGVSYSADEVDGIFSKLPFVPYDTVQTIFKDNISKYIENIAYERDKKKLLSLWQERSGSVTVSEWCKRYETPIQWVLNNDALRFVLTIRSIQEGTTKPDVAELRAAIDFFASNPLPMLTDPQMIAEAFKKEIGEESIEPFIHEREAILAQIRLKLGTDVFSWGYHAGDLRRVAEEYIRNKARADFEAAAKENISKMPEQLLRERILKFLGEHPEFLKRFLD